MKNMHRRAWALKGLFIPIIFFGITWIVMLLWNGVLPSIFDIKEITYWQAMGILILSKILFGGFGFGRKGVHFRHHHMRERIRKLSPDEREKFKELWRKRFQESSFFNEKS